MNPGSRPATVLVIDDQPNEILWLLDLIRKRGYDAELVLDEESARKRLEAVAAGTASFVLAFVDVMVATQGIEALIAGADVSADSQDSGIRLCRYARELGLSASKLQLASLTVRADDPKVQRAMEELGVPLFPRLSLEPVHPIQRLIDRHLPPLAAAAADAPAAAQ